MDAKERDAPAVGAFTPVLLSVYRDDQFANLSGALTKRHAT